MKWGLIRTGQGLLLLFLLALTVGRSFNSYNRHSFTTTNVQMGPYGIAGVNMVHGDYLDPMNGANLALGLLASGVFLLTFNRVFRGRTGAGLLDWLFAKPLVVAPFCALGLAAEFYRPLGEAPLSLNVPNLLILVLLVGQAPAVAGVVFAFRRVSWHAVLPLMATIGSLGLLATVAVVDTRFHPDPTEAVDTFAAGKIEHANTTGDVLFGQDKQGQAHMTWITPDLVRAFDRRSLSVYPAGDGSREYPLPGWLPIAGLLAVAVYAAVGAVRGGPAAQRVRARAALFFGLINLFVVYWTVVGAAGFPSGESDVMLPILGLVLLGVVYSKLKGDRLSPAARGGWAAVYFAIHLGAVAGIYLVSSKTPGTPALLWLLAYIVAGSLCWLFVLPGRQAAVAAAQVVGGTNA